MPAQSQGVIGAVSSIPFTTFTTMFSPSLRAFLAALVSSAVTVSAAPTISTVPSLTIKSSTPNIDVDGLENLRITTTIVNTGSETLKLLNDPRGVLSSFPENTFNITDAAGSHPSFNGARVNDTSGYLTNQCTDAFDLHL